MSDAKGILFVISGPSGTGKGSICAGLSLHGEAVISVSMTTRQPRPGEVDGKSYYFVEKEAFREIIEKDGFYEYAEVYDEYYGTPKAPVIEKLAEGQNVILEIDPQGAKQIKNVSPDCVLVFILPPSLDELRKRIEGRGSETPEKIEQRLSRARNEIKTIENYDYCVVNHDLDTAIADVEMIIWAEHIEACGPTNVKPDDKDKRAMQRANELRVSENKDTAALWLDD